MRFGPVRAALAAVALSVAVAACSGGSQAGTTPVANPGSGPFWVQVTCHDNSSDSGRLQRAINDSSPGATIAIGGSCLLTKGITLLSGRTYTGGSRTGTVLKQGAAMPYVMASAGFAANDSATGGPLSIQRLSIACSGSGKTDGIIILNWQADVHDVDVSDCGGSGIVDTSRTASGASITNTSVNSRFTDNFISGSGDNGFAVIDSRNSVTDGYFLNNQIASSGGDAIMLQNAAGWNISGNHLYDNRSNGILAERLFGTTISGNYIEDFGSGRPAGTWYGIAGTAQGGSGSTIFGNGVFNDRGESGHAEHVYIAIIETNASTGYLSVTGNVIVGAGHNDVGLSFSGGHDLVVASAGNAVSNVGTVIEHSGAVRISAGA
jgi:Right handed beta helix region